MVVLLIYVTYWLTTLTNPHHRSLLLITATLHLQCSCFSLAGNVFTILYTDQSTMIGCLPLFGTL